MSEEQRRIGVLGGTFDPIHYGHLIIAEDARATLGLERVLFVPARRSPLKQPHSSAPAHHRVRMVELAIASNPHFELSRVDLERPAPSYTVDTLRLLQEAWGPRADLYFIIGADSLADLLRWHQPEEIIRLCHLVVAPRPGHRADLEALETHLPGITARTILLHSPEVGIAAVDLRRRVREGQSITYQTPPEVEAYIREHRLYLPRRLRA
ncbi:MAG: nicotinate-nucleotide adenylyltransferase [Chloroflexi bacterium]|nr:nicotinate-nucleotide adenylyltransferase [Chloroflexota bacterium]